MRIKPIAAMTLFALATGTAGAVAEECTVDKLMGTWKLATNKYRNQKNLPSATSADLKLITPTHYTWVHYDPTTGKADAAGGGTFTVSGGTYTETVLYGFGFGADVLTEKQIRFSCSLQGNVWTHKGTILGGALEETWERVTAQK